MRWYATAQLFAMVVIAWIILAPTPANAQAWAAGALVVGVVDGDTVDVQLEDGRRERLRLIGMDTPELYDPRKPVQCFAQEASARAREFLTGQRVTIYGDPSQDTRDRYRRLLAYLWLEDGTFFNWRMIAEGYAHEYTYRTPYLYQAEFKAAQRYAQEYQFGLWSPTTCNGKTAQLLVGFLPTSPRAGLGWWP